MTHRKNLTKNYNDILKIYRYVLTFDQSKKNDQIISTLQTLLNDEFKKIMFEYAK